MDERDTVAEPRVGDLVHDDVDKAPVASEKCCTARQFTWTVIEPQKGCSHSV